MGRFDTLQALPLTASAADVQSRIMTRTFIITLAAAAALAGCNKDNHTINGNLPDDQTSDNLAAAAPIQLPPSITASKIYRCKDNSVVYIDWLSDNKSANVRTTKTGAATHVDTSAEGAPLKGDAKASSVTYKGETCKA